MTSRALAPRLLLGWLIMLSLPLLACEDRSRVRSGDSCTQEYEPPNEDGSCDAPATAREIAWLYGRGDMCTVECEDELDCPTVGSRPAHCLKVSPSSDFYCYTWCGSTGDCPEGWVCQIVSTATSATSVCLP